MSQNLVVRLDEETRKRLLERAADATKAKRERVTVSDLVRDAVERMLREPAPSVG